MDFREGTKEDVKRMVSSDAPDGTYLFRRSENTPDCITLCVKDGTRYNKYRIFEVNEDNTTTYMWINQGLPGADGPKEKFPTLNNLVQRKQKVFHLKKHFFDDISLNDEEFIKDIGGDTYNDLFYNTGEVVPFDGLGDLEAQLSGLKFYMGYMGGNSCNIALSNDPPGTYLLRRRSKEDPELRISYVTKEKGHRGYSHLQIKEMEDGHVGVNQYNKQLIAKSIEGLIAQMDGLKKPYIPKK